VKQMQVQLLVVAFCASLALAYNNGQRPIALIIATYLAAGVLTVLIRERLELQAAFARAEARRDLEAFYAQAEADEAEYRRRHLA